MLDPNSWAWVCADIIKNVSWKVRKKERRKKEMFRYGLLEGKRRKNFRMST